MQLDDITILDFTQLLPGPYATQLLADMGAEVIKIEPPEGDPLRQMKIMSEKGLSMFDLVNRGKQSVELNLTEAADQKAFRAMIPNADAVVEQFRPRTTESLGIDYDTVKSIDENIVYCSLTGYGQDGPFRAREGHDLNYIGIAGILDMTRPTSSDQPVIPGVPIADMAGGLVAAMTIAIALLSRELGGGGEYIDISMTDVALSIAQPHVPDSINGGQNRPPSAITGEYPCYNVYETSDGRYVTLAALEQKFWANFCHQIERPDLLDLHLSDDPATREHLKQEVREVFRSKTLTEWERVLGDNEAMVAPVYKMSEALESELVQTREMVAESNEGVPRIGFPAKISSGINEPVELPPDHGEDTYEVLKATDISITLIDEILGHDDTSG